MLAIVPDIQNHLILGGFLVGGGMGQGGTQAYHKGGRDREGHKPILSI